MTIGDVLDALDFSAGDSRGDHRAKARTWLNMARAEMADIVGGLWRTALNPEVTGTVPAGGTGILSLEGYEFVAGDRLFNITNNCSILPAGLGDMGENDPDKSETGQPVFWADAGMHAAGHRQIQLYPIPAESTNLRVPAYRLLTDIADEALTVDPFFGPVTPLSAVFMAGLRYYQALHDESTLEAASIRRSEFYSLARTRYAKSGRLSSASATIMRNVLRYQNVPKLGRFDPAHYEN